MAAEDTQKMAEALLDQARQLSDIRSLNAPGFRLSANFSFIGRDLVTVQGTYTEVWMSNSRWRRETVAGKFRRVEIGGPGKHWFVGSEKDFSEIPARVSTLVDLLPAKTAKFEFESITAPDTLTECAVTKAGAAHQRRAFCFDKNTKVIVQNVAPQFIGERLADYSCEYDQFRKIGDYLYPYDMTCFIDKHRKLELKVSELLLESSPDAALFVPPAGAIEMDICSQDPLPPQAISAPDPTYPAGARDRQSSVVVWMIVDTKGKPQSLEVARSGGEPFDEFAIAAVRSCAF